MSKGPLSECYVTCVTVSGAGGCGATRRKFPARVCRIPSRGKSPVRGAATTPKRCRAERKRGSGPSPCAPRWNAARAVLGLRRQSNASNTGSASVGPGQWTSRCAPAGPGRAGSGQRKASPLRPCFGGGRRERGGAVLLLCSSPSRSPQSRAGRRVSLRPRGHRPPVRRRRRQAAGALAGRYG